MTRPYRLGEAIGVEIEYQIVDRETGSWMPLADSILRVGTEVQDELPIDDLALCNELVGHVIEVKCPTPRARFDGLVAEFQAAVREVDRRLSQLGAMLLPGGAHPSEDPSRAVLWPHGSTEIYHAFESIFGFDRSPHGWTNLQSSQINLSFSTDEEFERLHAACRLLVPILPALAASTPFLDGRFDGRMDRRMTEYGQNSRRLPIVTADVVPEDIGSEEHYRRAILDRIGTALDPFPESGVLDPEFVNARGAIARFSRGSIEIRVIDSQECVAADLGILSVCESLVGALVRGEVSGLEQQRGVPQHELVDLFQRTIRDADEATCAPGAMARALGLDLGGPTPMREVWRQLIERHWSFDGPGHREMRRALDTIVEQGPLARRLLKRLGPNPPATAWSETCRELHACLVDGTLYGA